MDHETRRWATEPTANMHTDADAVPDWFECAGLRFTRLWHCFGQHGHPVDLPTAVAMRQASGTNVLPVNTHHLDESARRGDLLIGFGRVTFDVFRTHESLADVENLLVMMNVNHQTTAEAAVAKALLACRMTGEPVVKLEVLTEDLSRSNDAALIEAATTLARRGPDLVVMPLLSNDLDSAARLVDVGCPLLRVMGSPIGSGQGVTDLDTLAKICDLGVPVVLDGGVGSAQQALDAIPTGIDGVLVNSMLFGRPQSPVEILASLRQDLIAGRAWMSSPAR